MPRGGARPGSGPKPNPNSQRQKKLAEKAKRDALKTRTSSSSPSRRTTKSSSVLGHRFGKLPRGGFTGRVPAWPLSTPATPDELRVWKAAWRTPQAAAWATEPWRHRTVGLWVRSSVRCEAVDAPASIITATVRLADQIGLTPVGLATNGWEIEEAPGSRVAADASPPTPTPAGPQAPPVSVPSSGTDPRDRLKIVDGSGGR